MLYNCFYENCIDLSKIINFISSISIQEIAKK